MAITVLSDIVKSGISAFAGAMPIIPVTGNITVTAQHNGALFVSHSATPYVITVPTGLYSSVNGFTFTVLQSGTGTITIQGSGVTIYASGTAITSGVTDRMTVVLTNATSATVIKAGMVSSSSSSSPAVAVFGKTSTDSVAYFESFIKTTVSNANPYPRQLIFIPASIAPIDPKITIAISGNYAISEMDSGGAQIYTRGGYQTFVLGIGDYLPSVPNGGGTGMFMRPVKAQSRVDLELGTSAAQSLLEWSNGRGGARSGTGVDTSGWELIYSPFDGNNPSTTAGSRVISFWFRMYIGGDFAFPIGNAIPAIYCLQE